MPDNLKKTGAADRKRVSLKQPHERAYWRKRFGLTAKELEEIVAEVGSTVRAIEQFLSSQEQIVQIKVRMCERLRRKIDRSARSNAMTTNGEILRRLLQSFEYEAFIV